MVSSWHETWRSHFPVSLLLRLLFLLHFHVPACLDLKQELFCVILCSLPMLLSIPCLPQPLQHGIHFSCMHFLRLSCFWFSWLLMLPGCKVSCCLLTQAATIIWKLTLHKVQPKLGRRKRKKRFFFHNCATSERGNHGGIECGGHGMVYPRGQSFQTTNSDNQEAQDGRAW